MKRRIALAALPALALALSARGQDSASAPQTASPARHYVALSLVGDSLLRVGGGTPGGTGSMLKGHSSATSTPEPDAPQDRLALSALAEAMGRAEPTAAISGLRSSEASDFSGQDDWFSGDRLKLPDALRKAVQGEHAQRLLLVTKHRGLARVSDGHMSEGPATGHFEGLGLYFNGNQLMGNGTRGFMAPFVFIKLSVVDADTFVVLGSQFVESTRPMGLNQDAAAAEISRLLSAAILETTPKLIAAARSSS